MTTEKLNRAIFLAGEITSITEDIKTLRASNSISLYDGDVRSSQPLRLDDNSLELIRDIALENLEKQLLDYEDEFSKI